MPTTASSLEMGFTQSTNWESQRDSSNPYKHHHFLRRPEVFGDDAFYCYLFNIRLEIIVRKADIRASNKMFVYKKNLFDFFEENIIQKSH